MGYRECTKVFERGVGGRLKRLLNESWTFRCRMIMKTRNEDDDALEIYYFFILIPSV